MVERAFSKLAPIDEEALGDYLRVYYSSTKVTSGLMTSDIHFRLVFMLYLFLTNGRETACILLL